VRDYKTLLFLDKKQLDGLHMRNYNSWIVKQVIRLGTHNFRMAERDGAEYGHGRVLGIVVGR
jgi:hypothetical protein